MSDGVAQVLCWSVLHQSFVIIASLFSVYHTDNWVPGPACERAGDPPGRTGWPLPAASGLAGPAGRSPHTEGTRSICSKLSVVLSCACKEVVDVSDSSQRP